jgi:hypothetical protein
VFLDDVSVVGVFHPCDVHGVILASVLRGYLLRSEWFVGVTRCPVPEDWWSLNRLSVIRRPDRLRWWRFTTGTCQARWFVGVTRRPVPEDWWSRPCPSVIRRPDRFSWWWWAGGRYRARITGIIREVTVTGEIRVDGVVPRPVVGGGVGASGEVGEVGARGEGDGGQGGVYLVGVDGGEVGVEEGHAVAGFVDPYAPVRFGARVLLTCPAWVDPFGEFPGQVSQVREVPGLGIPVDDGVDHVFASVGVEVFGVPQDLGGLS